MHNNIYRKFGKITGWVSVGIFLFLLVLPLVVYKYTLSQLDEMPKKSEIQLSQQEVNELWALHETCNPKKCRSISPYWVYRWLIVATINDNVTSIEPNTTYSNVSKMASQIAISHMRERHTAKVKILWWHLTHVYLGIWLQTNWSADEIAAKYTSINA